MNKNSEIEKLNVEIESDATSIPAIDTIQKTCPAVTELLEKFERDPKKYFSLDNQGNLI